jgi:hypothetical protein
VAIAYRDVVFEFTDGFNPIPGGKNRCINLYRFNQYFVAIENEAPALILAIAIGIVTYFNLAELFIHVSIAKGVLSRNGKVWWLIAADKKASKMLQIGFMVDSP